MKNIRRTLLCLCSTVLLLLLLGFLPINNPSKIFEEDPDGGMVVALQQNQPLTLNVTPAENNWAGISLWTNASLPIAGTTPLTMTVNSVSGRQIRTVATTLSSALEGNSRELRFTFTPIRDSNAQNYVVSFAAPTLTADKALPLRKPILPEAANITPTAFGLLSSKPAVTILLNSILTPNTDGEDIYYYWRRGKKIAAGINPYACALDDTCLHHKNPGHFPLFYWLSAWSQQLGLKEYQDWIAFWRPVFLIVGIITGITMWATFLKRNQSVLAIFALLFWLFNRWFLYVVRVGQISFLGIFFFVVSLTLLKKQRWLSLLALSVSLAFKQLAIFFIPLYLIVLWHDTPPSKRLRTLLLAIVVIASVPFLTSLPFIIDNPSAVAHGLLFSITRIDEANFGAPSLSQSLELHGLYGIAFMVILMGLIYIVAWQKDRKSVV